MLQEILLLATHPSPETREVRREGRRGEETVLCACVAVCCCEAVCCVRVSREVRREKKRQCYVRALLCVAVRLYYD